MTLTTKVAITTPCLKPRSVFDFCQTLIGASPDVQVIDDPDGWMNRPDQGLLALMWVRYGPDGPIKRDCDCDYLDPPDRCSECRSPEAFVEASFDTPYGVETDEGGSCTDLHAALVYALGDWCDRHSLTWAWRDEFTGAWHQGREGLDTFGNRKLATLCGAP